MRILIKLIGLAVMLAGIYMLGQNILFTTQAPGYWWRGISAASSVISLLGGILTLMFARRSIREFGWGLIAIGIALVFISGGVILRPTTLWTFLLSFFLIAGGYQLLSRRRLDW